MTAVHRHNHLVAELAFCCTAHQLVRKIDLKYNSYKVTIFVELMWYITMRLLPAINTHCPSKQ